MSAERGRVIPPGFGAHVEAMVALGARLEGHLTAREIRFLSLLAAVPTADGEVLEIGSFKGKSTIILAKSVVLAGGSRVVAVDPLTLPSVTDPDIGDASGLRATLRANLLTQGVAKMVDFHQMRAEELGRTWTEPLRLLWIDGDHTYAGAHRDLETFAPFLSSGAIVAFHDTLHRFDGPVRVVCESLLLSDRYGASGVCGSIAWSQFVGDPVAARPFVPAKRRLHRQLSRLIPHVSAANPGSAVNRLLFGLKRRLVPHGDVDPERWLASLRRAT